MRRLLLEHFWCFGFGTGVESFFNEATACIVVSIIANVLIKRISSSSLLIVRVFAVVVFFVACVLPVSGLIEIVENAHTVKNIGKLIGYVPKIFGQILFGKIFG